MNNKQHLVLWMGFLLIVLRLFATDQWSQLWGFISKGSKPFLFGGGSSGGLPTGPITGIPFSPISSPSTSPPGTTVPNNPNNPVIST